MNHLTFPKNTTRLATFAAGAAAGVVAGWLIARSPEPAGIDHDASAHGTGGNATFQQQTASGPQGRRENPAPGSRAAQAADSVAFAESVRAIFRENDEDRRLKMFESLLERCSLEHYEVMVSLIRENDLRGCGSGKEWSLLWANWGRRDPTGGMDFITRWDWTGWHPFAAMEAKNKTVTHWAQTDPEAARDFVTRGIEADPDDRSLIEGLVRGLAAVDPDTAANWLFATGAGQNGEYKSVVEAISRKGGHEALDEWFASQSDAPLADLEGFANVIASIKRSYEPDKAAAWVEQHLHEPWLEGSGIIINTAHSFAERDPRAAIEWAERTGLEQAAMVTLSVWARQDADAAHAWLQENPDSPFHPLAARIVESEVRARKNRIVD